MVRASGRLLSSVVVMRLAAVIMGVVVARCRRLFHMPRIRARREFWSAAFPDPSEQEHFDERAAIMEFDGNLSRVVSEERAREEIARGNSRHSKCRLGTASVLS